MLSKSLQVSWQVVEKSKNHAERSEASAVSYWKRIKQILRFAQDDVAQGLFNNSAGRCTPRMFVLTPCRRELQAESQPQTSDGRYFQMFAKYGDGSQL